jgi:hypothetical protein
MMVTDVDDGRFGRIIVLAGRRRFPEKMDV